MAGTTGAIEVDGVDETRRALRRAADRADKLDREDTEAAEIIAEDARRRVRVDTGALLATIRVVDIDDSAAVVAGSQTVDYAPFVQKVAPFLDDRKAGEVVEYYEEAVSEIVTAFGREA